MPPPAGDDAASLDERSRRIIDIAYDMLEAEGLEGLTIRAVLAQTGLSRRAFYERFAGKDELMLAVFRYTIAMAARYMRAQTEHLDSPLERLERIVISIGLSTDLSGQIRESDRRGAALSREHLRLAESRPDELQAALRPLIGLITEELAQGMAQGMVRQGSAAVLAALVYNLISSTVHRELVARDIGLTQGVAGGLAGSLSGEVDRGAMVEEMWEFCRRAIVA